MNNYTVFKYNENILHFRDPLGTCFSIIKGKTLSLVIDTGYGIINQRQFVESIIETPYKVITTHGHMDHTAGSYLYDEVFIPKNDLQLYYEHNNKHRRLLNLEQAKLASLLPDGFDEQKYINATCKKVSTFNVGDVFDLGNYHLEVINMEGHTTGSIGLLLKEERLLFSGDGAILNIWLFLKESTDKETYIKMLEKVKELPFDYFLTGHLMRTFDKKYFDYFIEVAKEANSTKAIKTTFNNFERPNTYQYTKKIGDDIIGICFQEPKTNE